MELHEFIPDADVLISMEPEELGLIMLRTLATKFRGSEPLSASAFVQRAKGQAPNSVFVPPYPSEKRVEIEQAIREAWAWLQGVALLVPHSDANSTYSKLSRKGRRLGNSADPRLAHTPRRFPQEQIHPNIRSDVWTLFHRGKYDTAVFEAMKAVEVAVRDAARLGNDLVGVSLMTAAFKEGGPLADPSVDKGEQVARMNLFAGAIGSYKNPHSHRNVALDDPDEAAEIIMLASHLLRIIDARRDRRIKQ